MKKTTRTSVIGVAVSSVLGAAVAWAGSQGSTSVGGMRLFGLCAAIAFAVQWVVFVPSYLARTERFYDLTGSLTYITVTILALVATSDADTRAVVAAVMVLVWAGRLGTFLFRRVNKDGGDGRFDRIKNDPVRFLMTWTLQALWVLLTAACALAIITSEDRKSFGVFGVVGVIVWIVGFGIEVVSDTQKSAFRADASNQGRFISSGLWAWSRHPNYFGEIVLWTGMAILALPILSGWRWAMLISPVFVAVLLTRISGLPMLEKRADKRWGDEPGYVAYKARTPVLIPRPPSTPE